MITELHDSGFMKEKVSFLRTIARDIAQFLHKFTGDEFSDEGPEQIDERDAAELVASLERMDSDGTLWDETQSDHWLPRDAYAAIMQSGLDEYYRQNESVGPLENRFGEGLTQDPLVSVNLTRLDNLGQPGPRRFRLKQKDPRWVLVLAAKMIKRRRGAVRFPDNSASSTPIGGQARMILFGDWGSGNQSAIQLAGQVWNSYLLPDIGKRDLHVVHLGDVYYAGLPKEYERNFLRDWPVPSGNEKHVNSWCLAGNHDVFSGGQSYFEMLKDPRFASQKQGAYFLLENDHWQVFGLDTAFDPRDFKGNIGELYGEQAAWVAQKRAAGSTKKCLILTHHQPFSAYETVAENLERRLRPICLLGQIDSWFWGHEHLCAVYDRQDNIRYPVLLGHGGFPEKPKKKLPSSPPLSFEWTAVDTSGFLLFGFAVLDFDADRIHVQLVDENGKLQHSFTIQ